MRDKLGDEPVEGEWWEMGSSRFGRWGFDKHLKNYFVNLAKHGVKAVEMHANFPETIDLGEDFDQTLSEIRKRSSRTGKETYGLWGTDNESTGLYLSRGGMVDGATDHVSGRLRNLAEVKAIEKGVVKRLGHIHSHPRDELEIFLERLGLKQDMNYFSLPDYYAFLREDKQFMILVSGDENVMAVKSRETADAAKLLPEIWLSVWAEGYEERFESDRFLLRNYGFNLNQMVCEQYKIHLYRGKKGKELRRIV